MAAVCLLAVGDAFAASKSAKPRVTLVPSRAQEIAPGGSVTLTANATNATSYQWFKGSQAIEGATASSYVATAAGTYLCQVAGPGGTARSRAVGVTVAYAPASIAGRTLILNGDFRSVGRDSVDGPYDDTSTETVAIEVSANGRSASVWTEGEEPEVYTASYKRSGNRATLTFRGSFRYSDEINSGAISSTITLNLVLGDYDAGEGYVTGTFSVRGSSRGHYTYEDENGRTRRATISETMTGSGSVALD